eukprot:544877_1
MDRLSSLGDVLATWVTEGKFAGASAAIFRNNKLVYETYKGVACLDTKKPINKDSIFRCYSMTKPITAVALMILYDEGKFNLDDPVSKYIPNFTNMTIYDYESKENKSLDPTDLKIDNIKTKPCNTPISIRHVLAHTSGLCYCFDTSGKMEPVDKVALNYFNFHTTKEFALCDIIDNKLTKIPLCFEPGTKWNYGFNSDVCGRLVEIISGKKIGEFFYERIFKPLNMNNTAYYIDGKFNKLNKDDLCTLYKPSYYGKSPADIAEEEYTNYKVLKHEDDQEQFNEKDKGLFTSPGGSVGGLLSTLGDYMKFAKMLLNNGICMETGKRIILEKTLKLMRQNHLPNDSTAMDCMPDRSIMKHIMKDDFKFGLGFGVSIGDTELSEGTFWWGGAATTAFWVDPVKQIIVVFMTQMIGVNRLKFDWKTAIAKAVYESIVK